VEEGLLDQAVGDDGRCVRGGQDADALEWGQRSPDRGGEDERRPVPELPRTHRGDFLGIAPTGRELTFEGITIDRVVDGKIVEIYFGWDPDSVVEQLGAVLHAEPAEETNHT
jgi:hypothetical protein